MTTTPSCAACANCTVTFLADEEDRQQSWRLAFPFATAVGSRHYQCCQQCADRARAEGVRGIPTLAADARISANAMRRLKVTVTALTTGSESTESWWNVLEVCSIAPAPVQRTQMPAAPDAAMVRLNAAAGCGSRGHSGGSALSKQAQ